MNDFLTDCGLRDPLELRIAGPGMDHSESRPVADPFALVGRHELADISLQDEQVSKWHAYLQVIGGHAFCIDLGSRNGVHWGSSPRPSGWLGRRKPIGVGPYWIHRGGEEVSELPPGSSRSPSPFVREAAEMEDLPRLFFEVVNASTGRVYWRPPGKLSLIGTADQCQLRLKHPGVSRHHCSVLRTRAGVWVVDLRGGEGTYLNGSTVRFAKVGVEDTLKIGPFELRLHLDDPARSGPTDNLPVLARQERRPSTLARSDRSRVVPDRETSPPGDAPAGDPACPRLADPRPPQDGLILQLIYSMVFSYSQLLSNVQELVDQQRKHEPPSVPEPIPAPPPRPSPVSLARPAQLEPARGRRSALPAPGTLEPSCAGDPAGVPGLPLDHAPRAGVARRASPSVHVPKDAPAAGPWPDDGGEELLSLVHWRIAKLRCERLSAVRRLLHSVLCR